MSGIVNLYLVQNSAGNTVIKNAGFFDALAEIERASGTKFNVKGATGVASGGAVSALIGNRVGQDGDTTAIAADLHKYSATLAGWARTKTAPALTEYIGLPQATRAALPGMAKHLAAEADQTGLLDKKTLVSNGPTSWFSGIVKAFGEGIQDVTQRGLPADFNPEKIPASFTAQMLQLDSKLDPAGAMTLFGGAHLSKENMRGLMNNIVFSPTLPMKINGKDSYLGDPSTTYGVHSMRTGAAVGPNLVMTVVPKGQTAEVVAFQHEFRKHGYDPQLFHKDVSAQQTAEFAKLKAGGAKVFASTEAEMKHQGADFSDAALKDIYGSGRDAAFALVRQLAAEKKITVDPALLEKLENSPKGMEDFMTSVQAERKKKADGVPVAEPLRKAGFFPG